MLSQQLMMDIVLNTDENSLIDIAKLKQNSLALAAKITTDQTNYDQVRDEIKAASTLELKK